MGERIGLTTVYRTLQSLVDTGGVDVIRTESGQALYRCCSTRQHHHLVCRHCGLTREVHAQVVENWTQHVAAESGFMDLTYALEIFGVCPDCAG